MKKFMKSILVITIAIMLITVFPATNRIKADDDPQGKELINGVTYNIGDIIKISSETAYIIVDYQTGLVREIIGGDYTLPRVDYAPILPSGGYWTTEYFLPATDTYNWGFQFHNTDKTGRTHMVTGLHCYSGDGTENAPFCLEPIFADKNYVDVTVELGEGHSDLAAAFYNSLPDERKGSYKPGDTKYVDRFPSVVNNMPSTFGMAISDTRNKLENALPESMIDEASKEYMMAVAPQASYANYAEMSQDIFSKSGNLLNIENSYTLYVIWSRPVSNVYLNIDNPETGTKITLEGNYQSPAPNVVPQGGSYRISKYENRDYAYYVLKETKWEYSYLDDVTMEKGKSYTVYGVVEPDFGYYFDSSSVLKINDNAVQDYIIQPKNLIFFYDIEAVDDAFDVIKGEGQIWRQGQGELCFTFKRSVYDSMTFEYFDGIEVDGKHLDEEKDGIINYTYSAGSVNIQLQPEYLKSLSSGEHTLTAILKIDSVTMKADAIFTIANEESSSDTTYRLPKTGIE